jgi:uncharacterized protein (DUF1778 family)
MTKIMGRPTIRPEDRKKVTVTFRVTQHEKKVIQQAAAKAGKKFSEWARNRLLSADDVIQ